MALDQEFDIDKIDPNTGQPEMSFLDHVEELRWHLIRSIIAVLALSVLAFLNKKILFDQIIFGPKRLDFWTYETLCKLGRWLNNNDVLCIDSFTFKITNISMTGQLTSHMFIALIAGIIMAFPYILWEVWRFVKPALHPEERKKSSGLVIYGSLLFLLGILFGYFIISPISVSFMGGYSISPEIENYINLSSYISFVSALTFGTGIMFELPLLIYFLAKLGLITADFMRKYRRYAFLIILVIAAIITPPDVASQIILTIPIYSLYEIGIGLAARIEKQRNNRI